MATKKKLEKTTKLNKPLLYAIIAVFGFVLYGNTINHDYALDDGIVITQNVFTQQGIQGIDEIFKYDSFVGFWLSSYPNRTPEQIQEDKKLVAGGRYRPLSIATFAIEKSFFGDSPRAHHVINILIYILTGIVMLQFLFNLFPEVSDKWYWSFPFLAVLVFMAHPIHTEVVANIKGRDELLSFLGALIAGLSYFKYLEIRKPKYFVAASFAMFFGLMSKENTLTWLAVIPVAAWFFKEKKLAKHLFPFLSLLIPSVIYLIIRQSVLGWGGSGEASIAPELMNNPFIEAVGSERAGTILFTLWMYIRLLFFPHPLTYDYYPYHIELTSVNQAVPVAMLVLYLTMLVFAGFVVVKNLMKTTKPSWKMWTFFIVLYLAPLSVVSNVFFPVGVFMAERFVYFSSMGFAVMIAWLFVSKFPERFKSKAVKGFGLFVIFMFIAGFTVKTIARNPAWKDDFTLFTTDVKTSSNSAKANTTAGGKLLEKAKGISNPNAENYNPELAAEYVDLAITYLNRAVEIHPAYVDPMLLLGNAHYQKNQDIATAISWYAEILKIRPYHNLAIKNTQLILPQAVGAFASGKSASTVDEMITACQKFDAVKSGVPEVYRILGLMYARYKNDFETAIPYYEKALKINPNDADAWKDLGVIYGQSGDFEQALSAFLKASELNPEDEQAMFNIAVTYQNLGNAIEANRWFAAYKEKATEKQNAN